MVIKLEAITLIADERPRDEIKFDSFWNKKQKNSTAFLKKWQNLIILLEVN